MTRFPTAVAHCMMTALLPGLAAAGLPGFNGRTWFGILAPAGTPKPIVDKVTLELNRILATPEFRDKLVSQGLDPV